jgi:hypothetical protein
MKSYLRLLLASGLLLAVLGLFQKSPGDANMQDRERGKIEHALSRDGMLPDIWSDPPSRQALAVSPEEGISCSGHLKKSGNQFATRTACLLSLLSADFSNRKPDLVFRTGQYLHRFIAGEDPPLR